MATLAASVNATSIHATSYEKLPSKRWVVGSVGLTIAVCAIAFMILGCLQPDGFLCSVGTIGNPHSWGLWTLFGTTFIVGISLVAYAIFSVKIKEQKRISSVGDHRHNVNGPARQGDITLEKSVPSAPPSEKQSEDIAMDQRNISPPPPPPIEQVIEQATWVVVDPHPLETLLPSKSYPFIMKKFAFTLTIDQKKFKYHLSVGSFYEENKQIYAQFIDNDRVMKVRIDASTGMLDPQSTARHSWDAVTHGSVDISLDELIRCDGYLSENKAWCRLGCYLENNRAAWYFMRSSKRLRERNQITFNVPGLKNYHVVDSTITFERDCSQSLINSYQIECLEQSDIDWVQAVGKQLNNALWCYDVEKNIIDIKRDGDSVIVNYSK